MMFMYRFGSSKFQDLHDYVHGKTCRFFAPKITGYHDPRVFSNTAFDCASTTIYICHMLGSDSQAIVLNAQGLGIYPYPKRLRL
jgi:hypothetical protein